MKITEVTQSYQWHPDTLAAIGKIYEYTRRNLVHIGEMAHADALEPKALQNVLPVYGTNGGQFPNLSVIYEWVENEASTWALDATKPDHPLLAINIYRYYMFRGMLSKEVFINSLKDYIVKIVKRAEKNG
jgi:hypothetical protein